ncbi:exodeoxyribonuclease VII large subunit [Malikia spinosa]|uniref:Exodeoxyribonuclease 7 large subunit n=1 Tax=Malikia spinosa TaxID=86180 RepID=A0A7C9IZA0_9BURK|nr:exodeoxyribonuclease VII large subunit [Malikia spinosa]MYZ53147.1 exodeoxyribonuclease VII large subunit [Malikia spinosa]
MSATYLQVPFRDKDSAKALGARWDPAQRQWYVPAGRELAPFAAWLPADLVDASLPLPPDSTAAAVAFPARLPVAADEPAVPGSRLAAASEPAAAYSSSSLTSQRQPGISLSQLLAGVSQLVAQSFPSGLWTLVEVLDARLRNGHVYLELSERDAAGQVLAKANGMIWASNASRILPEFERATGATLGPGIKLLVRARPVFKPQYGFSLELDAIDSGYTLGDLEARKREIRERLQREGLYARQKQLALPWDYQQVLVIAPEAAAGLGDFQAEAARLQRHGVCRFDYAYSRFQGEGAAAEIRMVLLRALQRLGQSGRPDAVVIIRGGGAVNDLAWLNDYELARTCCELELPLLTGIGHERDNTLLDEVAQQRFDTPSKVIAGIEQLIVRRAAEARAHFEAIARLGQRSLVQARSEAQQAEAQVRVLALRQAREQSRLRLQQLGERATALTQRASDFSAHALQEVHSGSRQALRQASESSRALMREIAGQGPDKTLARGFAIVRDASSGQVLQRAAELKAGQKLQIQFHDGQRLAQAAGPADPSPIDDPKENPQ